MVKETSGETTPQPDKTPVSKDIIEARILPIDVKESTDEEKEKMRKIEEGLQKKWKQKNQEPKINLPEETPREKEIRMARIIFPEPISEKKDINPMSIEEKTQADIGLDLDEAKKYSQELYGPEKSSDDIGIENAEKLEKKPASLPSEEEIKRLREELLEKKSPVVSAVPEAPKAERDLSAAKKHLEDLYGPEKPSTTVSPQASEKFYSEEIASAKAPEKFYSTEIVDKSIPISEKPAITTEEPKKDIAAEGESRSSRFASEAGQGREEKKIATEIEVEAAKNELIELVRNVKEVKDKEEAKPIYEKIREKFEVATGSSLKDKASQRAKIEAEKEGLKITTKKEFLTEERLKQTEEKVKQREWSLVIRQRWESLSDKEKEKYFNKTDNRGDTAVINSAILKFASELEVKREELEKKGISLPKEAFYQMMRQGFKPEAIKKRGFFKRLFLGGSIEVPPLDKKDKRGSLILSKKDYAEIITKTKESIDKAAKERASDELESKVKEGRKRWINKRQRHAFEILQETTRTYEEERREKEKPKEEENEPEVEVEMEVKKERKKPKIEIVEEIGQKRTPERVEMMKKIREEVERSIKAKERKKWVDEIVSEIISKTGGKKRKTESGARRVKAVSRKASSVERPETKIKKGKKLKRIITTPVPKRIRRNRGELATT